jgi:magnesium-transporting ATPase (P-type)
MHCNILKGLSSKEAEYRLHQNGLNKLTEPPQTPWWIKFLKQFTGFFSVLLEIGALLCIVAFLVDLISKLVANKGEAIAMENVCNFITLIL